MEIRTWRGPSWVAAAANRAAAAAKSPTEVPAEVPAVRDAVRVLSEPPRSRLTPPASTRSADPRRRCLCDGTQPQSAAGPGGDRPTGEAPASSAPPPATLRPSAAVAPTAPAWTGMERKGGGSMTRPRRTAVDLGDGRAAGGRLHSRRSRQQTAATTTRMALGPWRARLRHRGGAWLRIPTGRQARRRLNGTRRAAPGPSPAERRCLDDPLASPAADRGGRRRAAG
jgi:hypothetical protein